MWKWVSTAALLAATAGIASAQFLSGSANVSERVGVRYVRTAVDGFGNGKIWFQIINNSGADWRVSSIRCEIADSQGTVVAERSYDMAFLSVRNVLIRETEAFAVSNLPLNPKFKCRITKAQQCWSGSC